MPQVSGAPEGPTPVSREHSGKKCHLGTLAGGGPGWTSTGQPSGAPDLRMCRNRGLRRQERGPVTARAQGVSREWARHTVPTAGAVTGLWKDQCAWRAGGRWLLTSHGSPCAQPRVRGPGRAGSEASRRRALGVWAPLLRRCFYVGAGNGPAQPERAETCTLGLPRLEGVGAGWQPGQAQDTREGGGCWGPTDRTRPIPTQSPSGAVGPGPGHVR